ncbi:MAG: VOC family protein [Candidatus Taylorbacteria bacterium]|nr:VOC family protein [Candidatus Taylorbacteria bacterium]
MKILGVDFVFYNVTNIKKAVHFYRDVLGLKVIGEIGKQWAEFDTGNIALSIGVYGATFPKKGEKGSVSVGLAVLDAKKSFIELKKRRVKINMDVQDFPPCFMFSISDPDGNEIVIHQRKDGTVG